MYPPRKLAVSIGEIAEQRFVELLAKNRCVQVTPG